MDSNKQENDINFTQQIQDEFSIELQYLSKLYNELNDLENDAEQILAEVKSSYAKGSLMFVQNQTSNLISIKKAKSDILRDRIAAKKIKFDLLTKVNKDKNNGEINIQEQVAAIYNAIKQDNDITINTENEISNIQLDNLSDKIQERMQKILENKEEELTDNDMNLKYATLNIDVQIKLYISKKTKTKNWKFVAVDIDTNEIISDYVLPNKKDFVITFVNIEGETKAIDQNEKIYNIYKKSK